MKRLVASLLLLLVLATLVVLPAWAWSWDLSAGEEAEPTRITDYRATFTVDEAGDLAVVEEVSVEFPVWPQRRGIFRYFDRADDNAPRLRRDPEDISVWMDGRAVEVVLLEESHGRYEVARVGSEDVTVSPGVHTYRISYTVDDVLLPDGDRSTFYWNLVPGGWRQPIEQATLEVRLPADSGQVRCAVGWGTAGGCDASGEGSDRLVVRTGHLDPRTPVTISTAVDLAVPEPEADRLWPARWDPVLGSSTALLAVVALAALAAGAVGLGLVRGTHEPRPGFPLMYAPPPGLGPAQGAYLLTERTDRDAFVATMLELAEHRAVDLGRDSLGWTVTGRPGGLESVDEVSAQAARLLGVVGAGEFTASRKSVADGKALKAALDAFEDQTRQWAASEGHLVKSGLGGLGGVLVAMAVVAAAVLALWNPQGMSALALVPGLFAVGGLWLLAPGAGTRRTASGRDLWSRLGGFRRVLSTPSSQQRFEFSGREELYTRYLPWAVAFGVAGEWAGKYRTEMGTEPPLPAYFGGYAGAHTGNFVDQMVHDFDATVSSAIRSYEASQRSSSSGGGGGFSGGGGGGGGGGGSW